MKGCTSALEVAFAEAGKTPLMAVSSLNPAGLSAGPVTGGTGGYRFV